MHTHTPHTYIHTPHIHVCIYMHKHSHAYTPLSHIHTNTYAHTLSHTYTHICTLSLAHKHTPLSLSHKHTHTPEKEKKSQNSLIPDGSSPMLDSELLSEWPGLLTMLLKRRVVTGLSQPCSRFWLRVRGRYWNVSRRKVVISSSTRQASILTA